MKHVKIIKWDIDDIKLKDDNETIYYLSGVMLINPPLIEDQVEHFYGNLESKEQNYGPYVLSTSDRNEGILMKQGENSVFKNP